MSERGCDGNACERHWYTMRPSARRVLVQLSVVVMVMGLTPASVTAVEPEPVTWVVEGEIHGFSSTLTPWIEQWVALPSRDGPGDEFRLEFTFDAATPDSIAPADFGLYEGAITSVSLTFGGLAGAGAVSGDISVVNGDALTEVDELTGGAGSSEASCGVGALAALGNGLYLHEFGFGMFPQVDVWDSEALPIDPPPVAQQHREVAFEVCHPNFPEDDPGRIGGFISRGSLISSWVRMEATCGGRAATIVGTSGDDVLDGTTGRDVIVGFGGNDVIRGKGGNDVICGDVGDDILIGGPGRDRLFGGHGSDVLRGAKGGDRLIGGGGADDLFGGPGPDVLRGGSGPDALVPGAGADNADGGRGVDLVSYFDVDAGVTVDLSSGSAQGAAVLDTLRSLEWLEGSAFRDSLTGDRRENWIFGLAGGDVINGKGGPDVLFGERGRDKLVGSGGADTLVGGPGRDRLVGGKGVDTVSYFDAKAGVTVNLATGAASGDGNDSLFSIEDIVGSPGIDSLTGDSGPNLIEGRAGGDTIRGGSGDDLLFGMGGRDSIFGDAGDDGLDGGAGSDRLDGGAGSDVCVNGERTTSCEAQGDALQAPAASDVTSLFAGRPTNGGGQWDGALSHVLAPERKGRSGR